MTDTDTRTRATCAGCGREGRARTDRGPWRCTDCRPVAPDPVPVALDWPRLVALAERRSVPVSRVDAHGRIQLIRTTAQLSTWGTRTDTRKETRA